MTMLIYSSQPSGIFWHYHILLSKLPSSNPGIALIEPVLAGSGDPVARSMMKR